MFVKICGITSEDDALLAVAMDADAIGFIFAPSRRQIAPAMVHDIVRRLPPEILTVGVFRDETPQRVIDITHRAGLRAAQLHGNETVEWTRWVAARVGFVIKAFSAGDPRLDRAGDYAASAILVDSETPGSGQVYDWSLAEGAPAGHRVIAAGGLTPDNVADAVRRIRPWGVDVASGVEAPGGDPGRKDPRLVRAFVTAAREADPGPYEAAENRAGPYDWMIDQP